MGQITIDFARSALEKCLHGERPALTVWEIQQLLHAWIERDIEDHIPVESDGHTSKQAWWAGARAGLGLPADAPRTIVADRLTTLSKPSTGAQP